MHTPPKGFRPETVDEQIEQFFLADLDQQSTPDVCVVQDLQGIYTQVDTPEQVRRSLDSIWLRLADQASPVNQTLPSAPDAGSLRVLSGDRQVSEAATLPPLTLINGQFTGSKQKDANDKAISLPTHRAPAHSRKQSLRRTLAVSTLAAVVVLSVLSWTLVTHLVARPSTITGSGPGTSTATPQPATPAPQDLRSQVQNLLSQFHQEVTAWGQTHQFNDTYNGKSYPLDYAYDRQGIGGVLDHIVQNASSSADFQAALTQIQDELTNLHAMEASYTDQTPYNQVHVTDMSLLNHYQLKSGLVIVVSLLEQSMRVYQNRQLIKAFHITSGRYEIPTLPGSWQIFMRQSPTTLKSSDPKGSPNWYPPTLVHYALSFHTGGYLIHDSWWRVNYGPGTNFPHHDQAGDDTFAGNGGQGSIEMATTDASWLYTVAQVNTPVVVY